ncbi:MAG: hypothetical protein K9N55_13385 [Phycisphaerae bacterium]|nr:hypothetical protein [Phycisphaerae bacterium]
MRSTRRRFRPCGKVTCGTSQLYAKINNVKTLFDGDITLNIWPDDDVDVIYYDDFSFESR